MKRITFSLFIAFLAAIITPDAVSQTIVDDSVSVKPGMRMAVAAYSAFIGRQSMVYSGPLYPEPLLINEKNHPWFLSYEWEDGTILVNNELYEHVAMKWDISKEELVVLHYAQNGGAASVKVFLPNVRQFSLLGHTFVRLASEGSASRSTFFDRLHDGHAQLVARRSKSRSEDVSTYGVEVTFSSRDKYYLLLDGKLLPVSGKSSIIKLLSEKKKELNTFAKQQRLEFGERKEADMIALVRYYDQIR